MGEKTYECKECGKTFHQGSDLMRHHRIHSGEKTYVCNECGKYVREAQILLNTIVFLLERNPMSALIVGRPSVRIRTLFHHQITHTGEKLFECHSCGKAFSGHTALKHQKLPIGKEPGNERKSPSRTYSNR